MNMEMEEILANISEPLPDFNALTLGEDDVTVPTTTLEQATDKSLEDKNGEDHTALYEYGLSDDYELDQNDEQRESVTPEGIRLISKPPQSVVAITIPDQVSENAMEESPNNIQDQPNYSLTVEIGDGQPNGGENQQEQDIGENQQEQDIGENHQEISEHPQEFPEMTGNTDVSRRNGGQDQERGTQPPLLDNTCSPNSSRSEVYTRQRKITAYSGKCKRYTKVQVLLAMGLVVMVIWGGVATHKYNTQTTHLEVANQKNKALEDEQGKLIAELVNDKDMIRRLKNQAAVLNQKNEALKDERGKLTEELVIAQCQDYSAPSRHPVPCKLAGSQNITIEGTPKNFFSNRTTTDLIPKNCSASRNWILYGLPKCLTETGNATMLQLGLPNPECPNEYQYYCICTGRRFHYDEVRDCRIKFTTVPKVANAYTPLH